MNSFVATMKLLNKMFNLNFYKMTHAYQELGLLPFLPLPGLKYFKPFSQEQTRPLKECHATPMSRGLLHTPKPQQSAGSVHAVPNLDVADKHILECKLLLILNYETGLVSK